MNLRSSLSVSRVDPQNTVLRVREISWRHDHSLLRGYGQRLYGQPLLNNVDLPFPKLKEEAEMIGHYLEALVST